MRYRAEMWVSGSSNRAFLHSSFSVTEKQQACHWFVPVLFLPPFLLRNKNVVDSISYKTKKKTFPLHFSEKKNLNQAYESDMTYMN